MGDPHQSSHAEPRFLPTLSLYLIQPCTTSIPQPQQHMTAYVRKNVSQRILLRRSQVGSTIPLSAIVEVNCLFKPPYLAPDPMCKPPSFCISIEIQRIFSHSGPVSSAGKFTVSYRASSHCAAVVHYDIRTHCLNSKLRRVTVYVGVINYPNRNN